MSAIATSGQRDTAPARRGGPAGFGRLMLAEWTKIRSVRSTVWTLLLFVIITVGLTALLSWLSVSHWTGPRAPARDATIVADPVGFIFGAGIEVHAVRPEVHVLVGDRTSQPGVIVLEELFVDPRDRRGRERRRFA